MASVQLAFKLTGYLVPVDGMPMYWHTIFE